MPAPEGAAPQQPPVEAPARSAEAPTGGSTPESGAGPALATTLESTATANPEGTLKVSFRRRLSWTG